MGFGSKIENNQFKQYFMCEKNFVTDYVLFDFSIFDWIPG